MKKLILMIMALISFAAVYACPVCERNKAKYLQGITHGSGPDSNWDLVIVAAIGLLTLFTLFYSVKWLIKPNENNPDHIKYSLFNDQ